MSLAELLREHLDHQEACGWHLDWPEALPALRAVLERHSPTGEPFTYCRECRGSEPIAYPCPTVQAVADALGVTVDGTVYTSRAEAP